MRWATIRQIKIQIDVTPESNRCSRKPREEVNLCADNSRNCNVEVEGKCADVHLDSLSYRTIGFITFTKIKHTHRYRRQLGMRSEVVKTVHWDTHRFVEGPTKPSPRH
jgi:hypothetical protein